MTTLGKLNLLIVWLGSMALLLGGIGPCHQAIWDGRNDLNVLFMTNLLGGAVGLWCATVGWKGDPKHRTLIFALLLSIAVLYGLLLILKFWSNASFSYYKLYAAVPAASLICSLVYAATARHIQHDV